LSRSAAGEKDNSDECRENGQSEITSLSVGQGGSPAKLLTVIHKLRKIFYW
jgi:hypothetical protein